MSKSHEQASEILERMKRIEEDYHELEKLVKKEVGRGKELTRIEREASSVVEIIRASSNTFGGFQWPGDDWLRKQIAGLVEREVRVCLRLSKSNLAPNIQAEIEKRLT
jgi:hypothetical protein